MVPSGDFELFLPVCGNFITAACCPSLGIESGRSMQRLHTGGSQRFMPPVCGLPEGSRYAGGAKGACDVSKGWAEVGGGPHAANEAREATPVPPAPAKSNRTVFPEDDFTTRPTDTKIVQPLPTIDANDTRVTANRMTWLLEKFPAQGTGIVFLAKAGFLISVISLQ